jgi:CheY-like chemotaxis protein
LSYLATKVTPLKRIFLIDDDPIYVLLTKKIISNVSSGFEITEFGDGQLALERLIDLSQENAQLPDIIFLDLSMPVMDGWEFLAEYSLLKKSLKKEIILYIVSSSISPREVERSKEYHEVVDFLIKPLEKETIAGIMQNIKEK